MIDAKALLKGNDLEVPTGHSTKSFIEFELGVKVIKCTKGEEVVVVGKQEEPIVSPLNFIAEEPNEGIEQEQNKETPGGEN